MSRLVDADALKQAISKDIMGGLNYKSYIDHAPTIDAVPVVRCKDCKFAHLTYDGECKYCDAWSEEFDGEREQLYLSGDFYCSFGEKVTE